MKVKDTIEFDSGVPPRRYKGVVTWMDSKSRDLGVAIIAPKDVRGGCLVINMDEAKPEVIEEYMPHTFRQDLSELSEEELRTEIEDIRDSRSARKGAGKTVKRQPKAIKQLALLSDEAIEKILEGK